MSTRFPPREHSPDEQIQARRQRIARVKKHYDRVTNKYARRANEMQSGRHMLCFLAGWYAAMISFILWTDGHLLPSICLAAASFGLLLAGGHLGRVQILLFCVFAIFIIDKNIIFHHLVYPLIIFFTFVLTGWQEINSSRRNFVADNPSAAFEDIDCTHDLELAQQNATPFAVALRSFGKEVPVPSGYSTSSGYPFDLVPTGGVVDTTLQEWICAGLPGVDVFCFFNPRLPISSTPYRRIVADPMLWKVELADILKDASIIIIQANVVTKSLRAEMKIVLSNPILLKKTWLVCNRSSLRRKCLVTQLFNHARWSTVLDRGTNKHPDYPPTLGYGL